MLNEAELQVLQQTCNPQSASQNELFSMELNASERSESPKQSKGANPTVPSPCMNHCQTVMKSFHVQLCACIRTSARSSSRHRGFAFGRRGARGDVWGRRRRMDEAAWRGGRDRRAWNRRAHARRDRHRNGRNWKDLKGIARRAFIS